MPYNYGPVDDSMYRYNREKQDRLDAADRMEGSASDIGVDIFSAMNRRREANKARSHETTLAKMKARPDMVAQILSAYNSGMSDELIAELAGENFNLNIDDPMIEAIREGKFKQLAVAAAKGDLDIARATSGTAEVNAQAERRAGAGYSPTGTDPGSAADAASSAMLMHPDSKGMDTQGSQAWGDAQLAAGTEFEGEPGEAYDAATLIDPTGADKLKSATTLEQERMRGDTARDVAEINAAGKSDSEAIKILKEQSINTQGQINAVKSLLQENGRLTIEEVKIVADRSASNVARKALKDPEFSRKVFGVDISIEEVRADSLAAQKLMNMLVDDLGMYNEQLRALGEKDPRTGEDTVSYPEAPEPRPEVARRTRKIGSK